MLFLTTYHVRSEVRMDPASFAKVITEYANRGDAPGTIAHYVAADGRAGYTVREVASLRELYESSMEWDQYLDIEAVPIMPIGDVMGMLGDHYVG